jgi:hypothetical protein
VPHSEMASFPLSRFFLEGYFSKTDDSTNFPPEDLRRTLGNYETLFGNVLSELGMTKEQLRSRSEFNFDSGNAANLEGSIAILRVVEALRLGGFSDIELVSPRKGDGVQMFSV